MRTRRRALLLSILSAALAASGLYILLASTWHRKSYNSATSTATQNMSKYEELTGQASLRIDGKREVAGNLAAAKLSGAGVEFFTFGEYFEAEPLIIISDPRTTVLRQEWADGVSYRALSVGGARMEDKLITYEDSLAYVIQNTSESESRIKINGMIQVFSWFLPQSRDKIAEMAGSKFSLSNGELLASYTDKGPFISIKSNRKLSFIIYDRSQSNFSADIKLAPSERFVFVVSGHQSSIEDCLRSAESIMISPETIEILKRNEVGELIRDAAGRHPVNSKYEKLLKYMWNVILYNRVRLSNHPVLTHPFIMPSKFGLRHQWLWDSAFHSIVLSKYSVDMAKEELQNLFNAQKEDGRIPHEIFLSKEFCQLFWNVDDYAPWTTQPPVLALAVEKIMESGGDKEFIERAYHALSRYDKWFRSQRDMDGDQLMAYVDFLESGWDNSVRWDEPQRLFSENPEKYRKIYGQIRMAPVEAVDLNCLIYLQRKTLSKIAEQIGLNNEAEEYRLLAETTAERIRQFMWDEEVGLYFDIYEEDHKMIKVKTPAAFLTLYAGIATRQQAENLVEHLFNPKEFWTTFPIPTVSVDDPNYDPRGYWRGR
ncbi:MAG: trehalase family glycosidase, partial [Aigarchaeota archaeon]|nr:trehalase family glycosidase [Candidatus Calditenuaceae archaeon]